MLVKLNNGTAEISKHIIGKMSACGHQSNSLSYFLSHLEGGEEVTSKFSLEEAIDYCKEQRASFLHLSISGGIVDLTIKIGEYDPNGLSYTFIHNH